MQALDSITERIVEAVIPDVGRCEVGRIMSAYKDGVYVGSFYTSTKHVRLPASKRQVYGINYGYLR